MLDRLTNASTTGADDQSADRQHPTFDCTKDEIRVLLEPETLDVVERHCIGMGIKARWVQIVRKQDWLAQIAGWSQWWRSSGQDKEAMVFWYVDQIAMTIPSYYADK